MLLEKLTLENVGTYSGRQSFDLVPRKRTKESQNPVILFGGLNGTGKTTFLTAVRLALYGRQSLESGSTQKEYEAFLKELIHRPKHALVTLNKAAVVLEFIYARFGVRDHYKIVRSWTLRGQHHAEEKLTVLRTGQDEETFAGEQAQSFLNQMIPPGVAQFFFFDGEKIASLAKDDSDIVLADAIRRLLGLDLADRLGSDMSVYLRQLRSTTLDAKTLEETKKLQSELEAIEHEIDDAQEHLDKRLTPELTAAKLELECKRAELSDRGGAWAVDRNSLEAELDELRQQRLKLEGELRESLSGMAIFSLAPRLGAKTIATLESEQAYAEHLIFAKSVQSQIGRLKERITALEALQTNQADLVGCIDAWVSDLTSAHKVDEQVLLHGLKSGELHVVIESLGHKSQLATTELVSAFRHAISLVAREDFILDKLAHAPDNASLTEAFEALTQSTEKVARLDFERRSYIETMRRKIWQCIELVRKLKKLEARVAFDGSIAQSEVIAESLHATIAEFKLEAAKAKCESLRRFFIIAFSRLARKDDIIKDVRIDPYDFSLTLLDHAGRDIPKKRLSAGEKQIYAIAMLEALAKTSGRNLPIIIDTPLGRLDSKHRSKLVESYFPYASHQVLVLSTDTEVDQPFYYGLEKHISHAFHLSFNAEQGTTQVEEGYFWPHAQRLNYAS
jgi:DNA sulfur modification protein DndD